MWTFRKGKIGAWREKFTPEQRLLFKEKNQKLLEKLGYEINDNWVTS